jgi:hypothetical protein
MRTTIHHGLAAIACCLATAPAFGMNVWFVNAAATPPFDGSSFAHGFQTIQQGVNAASDGDEVDVAQGVYPENVRVPVGVSFWGGFSGSGTQQDPVAYPTVIDGGGRGPVLHLLDGNVNLDAFTIRNGSGIAATGKIVGGGVLCENAGLSVANCTFLTNTAGIGGYGGAIAMVGTSRTLFVQSSMFTGNTADFGGAIAILSTPVSVTIEASAFDHNSQAATGSSYTGSEGGAIYTEPAATQGRILNNAFTNNTANFGGAVYLKGAGNETIASNTFDGNTAHPYGNGGALYIEKSDPVSVTMNLFNANTAESYGGAIYSDTPGASSVTINGNVLTGNRANAVSFKGISGGGIVSNGAYIINNTIVSGAFGAALSLSGPSYTANNILAFNPGGMTKDSGVVAGPIHNNDVYGNVNYDYGNITDPTGTSGNIKQDPQFINLASGDVHLHAISPCLDAGNDSDAVAYAGTKDFDGEARLFGPHVDIGADEFVPVLTFITQPGNGRPNQPLAPPPAVAIQERGGGTLTAYHAPVTVSLPTYFTATLSGTKTVNAVNGVATFGDLSIDKPGLGYTLDAASPSLIGATSLPFNVLLQRSYVKAAGNDSLDGSTWDNAKGSITSALALTGGPDAEVWVAGGTYTGPVMVPDGITLYGGFAGTETTRDQRSRRSRSTIINGGGVSAAVRFVSSDGNGIDGFKITGGIGYPVVDAQFRTHREGGGIYVHGASPLIANNLITRNSATIGGGIAVDGGSPRITGNTISLNNAAATTTLQGVGGGLLLGGSSGLVLADNFITGNTASGANAAHVSSVGGAIAVTGSVTIRNNTFVLNESPTGQGDIYLAGGSPRFTNNIITTRDAIEKTGGTPAFSHNDYIPGLAVANPLPNPNGTNGNVTVTPGFINAATNFHLAATSPLANIGDPAVVERRESDVDGEPRVMGPGVDIGADEIVVPFATADADSALSIAGGLQSSSVVDAVRLDLDDPAGIDLLDAALLIRKATGLDPNP